MRLAGSLAGIGSRAACAAASWLLRAGDLVLRGGDQPGVLGGRADGRVGEQHGQVPLGGGEGLFCLVDGGIGLLAGRVVDDLGVGLDAGDVIADLVDAVVLAGVLEEVLLPPPRLQPGQDLRRAGVKVRGQDLQHHLAVLEQRELPGLAVVLELDFLLGPGDLARAAAGGDRGDDREHGRDGQRRPPVADPVHALLAAVPEHLRIRAAPVEPQHDPRARRRGLLQLRQRLGQRDRQPGRLPGHEAHRPPVMRGDVGVRAAPFRLAALVVPALARPAWRRRRGRSGHRRSRPRR